MKNDATANNDIRTLGELIEDIEIAMLVSIAPDGGLVSRPLATLETDRQGDLWFFTHASSGKVEDIERHPQVNLCYASPENNLYVSVVGNARVLRDREKIAELWHPRARTFFPGGKDDPDLALIKVTVESAEYWRQAGGLMHQALQLMRAVTGQGPQDLGENRQLHIRD